MKYYSFNKIVSYVACSKSFPLDGREALPLELTESLWPAEWTLHGEGERVCLSTVLFDWSREVKNVVDCPFPIPWLEKLVCLRLFVYQLPVFPAVKRLKGNLGIHPGSGGL